ncbi:uncharacterized protein LOC130441673 [Diorhabda sublineata]|uniref:uncharacterized protein LOC130441673 n=1 Tax=Diorhabda sublineata TaxID=1163346 RepID=UPI0024E0CEB4|nr:uncharacterized protein LOC130441673 [Diorhabda sublineata]
MTYVIETREETNRIESMLRVAEMETLKTIVVKTRVHRVRNTDIREQCGVQDIVIWGRQRKRYWYAHVRRMEESRMPRIVLEGKPIGKREHLNKTITDHHAMQIKGRLRRMGTTDEYRNDTGLVYRRENNRHTSNSL